MTLLLGAFLIAPLLSGLANTDPIIEGRTFRPGMSLTFTITGGIGTFIELLPFMLGYRLLWNLEGARTLLQALVTGMLAYSVLMLFEVRMSPQLNLWIYGYFQHDFGQTMRYGGFRPIVFLNHSLWVGSITMMGLFAAVALYRASPDPRARATAGYMAVVLVFSKCAGVLLLSIFSVPFLLFARARTTIKIALIAAVLTVAYPILRTAGLIPLEQIVNLAFSISTDRGGSLHFRLINEELILDRAMERPIFGWGAGARSLIFDPFDGQMAAIPDGLWAIWISSGGIFGYLARFLVLLTPVWAMHRAVRTQRVATGERELYLMAGLSMIVAMNMVDLLPNATATPITWLIAGTLMGNARRIALGSGQPEEPAILPTGRGLRTIL